MIIYSLCNNSHNVEIYEKYKIPKLRGEGGPREWKSLDTDVCYTVDITPTPRFRGVITAAMSLLVREEQ